MDALKKNKIEWQKSRPPSKEDIHSLLAICKKFNLEHPQEAASIIIVRDPAPATSFQTYFDTGIFPIWDYLEWSNPDNSEVVNWSKLGSYLSSLFGNFKANHFNKIYLAFSQIADIGYLNHPDQWSSTTIPTNDAFITNFMYQVYHNCPKHSLEQFLTTFTDQAHANDVKVILSFGGENATGAKICPDSSQTPEGQATELATFLKTYGFDGADFDLESDALTTQNSTDEITEFFSSLKTSLSSQGQTSTITLMGAHSWGTSTFNMLFNPSFSTYFDSVNLMLYGSGGAGGQYYIDATDASDKIDWGIDGWINLVGTGNSSAICIGFQDNTYYENPQASAGETYNVDSSSRGKSAAMIYKQMIQKLSASGCPTTLGECFWWPDPSVKGAGGTDRYAPKSDGSADFLSQTMIDFATNMEAQDEDSGGTIIIEWE